MSIPLLLKKYIDTTALSTIKTKNDSIVSISSLIPEQLPDFVRLDHPRLVEFLEAYYEWMEQKNETLYSTFILQEFSDIDSTIDEFVKHFKSQYLEKFPQKLAYDKTTNSTVDEKRLLKRIKEFYRAKGTEKAYKLLFRILHDAEITSFYYPKIDILKPSYGRWITKKSIKTSFTNQDELWNSIGKPIIQLTPMNEFIGSAVVRHIIKYDTSEATVAEIFLDELNGEFKSDFVLTLKNDDGDINETPHSVITKIKVSDDDNGNPQKGTGYRLEQKVNVISATGGEGGVGKISSIDSKGGITSIELINSGVSYTNDSVVSFDIESPRGSGATLDIETGTITEYPGYYLGTEGQVSSNKHLIDNYFYQDFSYEIKTDIALKSYKKGILDLIHPAGMKLFNMMLLKKVHPVNTKYKTSAEKLEISILGHYTPYTWNTVENLRHNSSEIDCYPFGYNPNNALSHEGATVGEGYDGHTAHGVRGNQWFGQVYNDDAGRTAQSDSITSGMTHSFLGGGVLSGAISGGTWDSGTTGPLWNLSEGVFINSVTYGTGGASAAYEIVGTADAGDFEEFGSYWVIYPHPNSRGITGIESGCSFSDVLVNPFLFIDRGETAGIETTFTTHSPT